MGVEIERKWLLDKPMSGNIKCIEVDGQYTIVEVEFDNVEAANAYTPPFEGTEVTDNPDYYKRNYWKKTRLEK